MKVFEPVPQIDRVEKTNYASSDRLYGRHVLYNSHELYLLAYRSGSAPMLGSVENIVPH